MKRSRFSENRIFAILKETEAGAAVKEACRRHGVSPATYYQWKSKYGEPAATDGEQECSRPRKGGQICLPADGKTESVPFSTVLHRRFGPSRLRHAAWPYSGQGNVGSTAHW